MSIKKSILVGILLVAVSFCGLDAFADSTSTFSVDVDQVVLELTIPETPAVINLTPTATGAAFGTTTIPVKVATNNVTGYTLTMSPTNAVDNSALIRTELVGEEQEYRKINSLVLNENGYSEQDFTTDAWGYKIVGDNYFGVSPTLPVSSTAWINENPTNGDTTTLTLAAKVGANTVSGAYETTLNFQAVTNTTLAKHTLSFKANGGTGSMEDIIVMAGDTETLPSNSFAAPAGKKFLGWSTSMDGAGMVYDNGATYTAVDTGVNKKVDLYAIWVDENFPVSENPSGTTGTTLQRAYEIAYTAAGKGMYVPISVDPETSAITYKEATSASDYEGIPAKDNRFAMQDMTSNICASATAIRSKAHVVDTRDWYSYWILKAEDGRCWMTQDLNFYITGETLTHDTTDIGYGEGSERTSWTPPAGAITVNRSQGWPWTRTPISREPNNTIHDGSSTQVNHYNVVDETDNTLHLFGTLAECTAGGYTEEHCEHSHLGIFYNWAAATMVDQLPTENNEFIMPDSICPANWKLPLSTEYQELVRGMIKAGVRRLLYAPYYFTGVWNSFADFPAGQRTWASNSHNRNNAYMLSEGGEGITYWSVEGYEVTVRCIAR